MSEHRFRNPDKFQVDPGRQYIRVHCPDGSAGFVAEDLDLVLRTYGPNFKQDATGSVRLVEIKYANTLLGQSKLRTFGLMEAGLRAGLGKRYGGFYVVRVYGDIDPKSVNAWEYAEAFNVNGWDLDHNEFQEWLLGRRSIEPAQNLIVP